VPCEMGQPQRMRLPQPPTLSRYHSHLIATSLCRRRQPSVERVFGQIVEHLAGIEDYMLAKVTFDAAVKRWPKETIRLCAEVRIIDVAEPWDR
jgi:hypothetical protein